jgi:methionyl-tRNA formyltransferase
LAGDEFTGTSLMLMDEGMDTGPILAQEKIPILPQDTTISLQEKLAELGAKLLEQTLPLWVEGKIKPKPQAGAEATHSQLIAKEDGEINWQLGAIEIWRRVRAFQPWPGSYTTWGGKQLKIIQASPLPNEKASQPGKVIALKNQGVGVETGQGVIQLLQVQLEGRKVMPIEQFVLGQKEFIGSHLPSLQRA